MKIDEEDAIEILGGAALHGKIDGGGWAQRNLNSSGKRIRDIQSRTRNLVALGYLEETAGTLTKTFVVRTQSKSWLSHVESEIVGLVRLTPAGLEVYRLCCPDDDLMARATLASTKRPSIPSYRMLERRHSGW